MCKKVDKTFVPLIGFEGQYEINKLGQIKSLPRKSLPYATGKAKGACHTIEGKIKKLTPSTQPNSKNSSFRKPYLVFNLNHNSRRYLHQELAKHFIPNPENKKFVDHIDRNPLNNCICNLRWVDSSDNIRNSSRYSKITNSRGVAHYLKIRRYQARMKIKSKLILGKLTYDIIEAMRDYDDLVKKHMPEHGVTNEMLGLYKLQKK